MNGAGGGGSAHYISEDDFEDYKQSPAHPSSSASYYSAPPPQGGNPVPGPPSNQPVNFATGGSGGGGRNQICCLVDDGKRCSRIAGNASYSKRIQKTVYYKRLKLEIDVNVSQDFDLKGCVQGTIQVDLVIVLGEPHLHLRLPQDGDSEREVAAEEGVG